MWFFNDTSEISINSPKIEYARTENADFGQVNRRDILKNVADFSPGFDIGLVYEWRINEINLNMLILIKLIK
ncbi:MAG: hypothetical protein IPP71_16870 [Bacteroidetes bacterium]|nr:hypothetical protein [Bacteroidota bacterium]